MKKISRLLCCALLVLPALAGCAGGPSATSYYRTEQLMDQARSYTYQLDYDSDSNLFLFQHKNFLVKLSVYTGKTYSYGLALFNKTDQPLTIDWNRVEYLDVDGGLHSMIHEGVPYLSPVSAQRPTVIMARSGITDLLRPADRQEQDGAQRFVPAVTPTADDVYDQVTIAIPMKILGAWGMHRFTLSVAQADPVEPPFPLGRVPRQAYGAHAMLPGKVSPTPASLDTHGCLRSAGLFLR